MSETEAVITRMSKIIDQIANLSQALACVDCTRIYRYGDTCPHCGSRAIINLAEVLSRSVN